MLWWKKGEVYIADLAEEDYNKELGGDKKYEATVGVDWKPQLPPLVDGGGREWLLQRAGVLRGLLAEEAGGLRGLVPAEEGQRKAN